MDGFVKSRFIVELSLDHISSNDIALYHTMTDGFVLLPNADWESLNTNNGGYHDTETADILIQQGFFIKKDVDEESVFDLWHQQHVHDYSQISSKVLVTRKCNNRCIYCILDPEDKEMSEATAATMDDYYINLIAQKRPFEVKDDFLGGEPLLKTNIICTSAKKRFSYCSKTNVDYSFSFTTNGILLNRDDIKKMKTFGLSGIRVSMAGPMDIHDRLRPKKDGGKTYHIIVKRLQEISDIIPVTIECQYDSGTKEYLRFEEMLYDFKVSNIEIKDVYFTPILAKSMQSPFNSGLGDPEIPIMLNEMASKYGFCSGLQVPLNLCKADFRSMFVFDTDGTIIPCSSLQSGERKYGHVSKGVDFVAESQIIRRNLPARCRLECAILPLCMGGCRLQADMKYNDFNGVDCNYDNHMKALRHYMRQLAKKHIKN